MTCRGQSAGQFWCDNNFLSESVFTVLAMITGREGTEMKNVCCYSKSLNCLENVLSAGEFSLKGIGEKRISVFHSGRFNRCVERVLPSPLIFD